MVVNVGVGLKVIRLKFDTFLGLDLDANHLVILQETSLSQTRNLNLKMWRWNLQSKMETTRKALLKPNHHKKEILKHNLTLSK